MTTHVPTSVEAASEAMRACSEAGTIVRLRGAGTKYDWGTPVPPPDAEVSTLGLAEIVEHNAGDLTAIVDAGVTLAAANDLFASAGQMLAFDPPMGAEATIGGIVATADSGPLRHRYGGVRDQVVGMTVVLSDGTVARSGGKVIKNVAGYDLGKLFAGSFGTLGLIARVVVRLYPAQQQTATIVGRFDDPALMARAASAVAHAPVEADCLDVVWEDGMGELLARFSGAVAAERAAISQGLIRETGAEVEMHEDDDDLWERSRRLQRAPDGAVARVAVPPAEIVRVVEVARRQKLPVVLRAALGLGWIRLDDDPAAAAETLLELRTLGSAVLTDAPQELRAKVDPWGDVDTGAIAVMRRIKKRFDPSAACAPGIFAGGI